MLAAWVADQQNCHRQGGGTSARIADQATVDGRDDNPAFMDGHGVISAAHLRDLLARDDVRVRPLNPQSATTGSRVRQATTQRRRQHTDTASAGVSLPTHLPWTRTGPSTALDTFIRARDGYHHPGCDQPA